MKARTDSTRIITTLQLGRQLARRIFAKRGNKTEVHLTEAQLAAILTLAAQHALSRGGVTR